jgi:5,10-methylenetetrahydrofolate reductase
MSRSFGSALRARPLVFAPALPAARASPKRFATSLAETAGLLDRFPRIDAVNVPELVDENHEGRPYYRTTDPRAYGAALAERARREVIVNKVVAHLASGEAVREWAVETVRLGVRYAMLVGGSSRYIPYPGPPVAEANALAQPILAGAGGLLGNIAIPQRTGEAHRMLAKTRAGASFFTTQLLFDSRSVIELLRRYDRLCREGGVAPAAVLVSLAPVGDEGDAGFVRWLGADLPDEVEQEILDPEGGETGPRSIDNARALWLSVRDRVEAESLQVPLGVHVEQLSARHLAHAEQLLRALTPELDPQAGAPVGEAAGPERTPADVDSRGA